MDHSASETRSSSVLSSPHEAYVPPSKPPPASNASEQLSEPASLRLDLYLPLGSLRVKLEDPSNVIEANDWVEAEDFLPFVIISHAFNTSLAALWRAQWVRVFRLPLALEQEEAWRIYILPDVGETTASHGRS